MAHRSAWLVTSPVLLEGLAWMATATIGLLAVSQLARATWHPVLYVLQALTVARSIRRADLLAGAVEAAG